MYYEPISIVLPITAIRLTRHFRQGARSRESAELRGMAAKLVEDRLGRRWVSISKPSVFGSNIAGWKSLITRGYAVTTPDMSMQVKLPRSKYLDILGVAFKCRIIRI